jgi:hypothetical protein
MMVRSHASRIQGDPKSHLVRTEGSRDEARVKYFLYGVGRMISSKQWGQMSKEE